MSQYEQYRPPGRSNRSGRSNADNDVFEGLPVKQWGQTVSRVSLAPPVIELPKGEDDKWADPPMPRDFQLLQPWTQQLLRLARSGKVGTKRKQDPDSQDEDRPDEETADESKTNNHTDNRGYVTKKWKPVPESMLEPEHKHFEFLAKRRKGLSGLYGQDQQSTTAVPMRKTKVQKIDANGIVTLYEVLVPEGQTVEGEVAASTELADIKPVLAAPGTVIEGVGIVNEDGVVVAEHLRPVAPRRNRPPPKKKGGPGRGKKRVTFTNPDGSTYTTIVPNATKIVPQPGQTVKHVAKGEEATADVTAEEAAAAAAAATHGRETGDEGSGSDDGDEDGEDDEDDDDREEGELSEEDAPTEGVTPAASAPESNAEQLGSEPMEDVNLTGAAKIVEPSAGGTPTSAVVDVSSTIVAPPGATVVEETLVEDTKDEEQNAEDPPETTVAETTVVETTVVETNVAEKPVAETPIAEAPTAEQTQEETPRIEELPVEAPQPSDAKARDPSSSPETPLVKTSHSRTGSLAEPPVAPIATALEIAAVEETPVTEDVAPADPPATMAEAPPISEPVLVPASVSEPLAPTVEPDPEPVPELEPEPEPPSVPVADPSSEPPAVPETDAILDPPVQPSPIIAPETQSEAEPAPEPVPVSAPEPVPAPAELEVEADVDPAPVPADEVAEKVDEEVDEAEEDLLGNLEKHLEGDKPEV